MGITRKRFLQLLGLGAVASLVPGCVEKKEKLQEISTGYYITKKDLKPGDLICSEDLVYVASHPIDKVAIIEIG